MRFDASYNTLVANTPHERHMTGIAPISKIPVQRDTYLGKVSWSVRLRWNIKVLAIGFSDRVSLKVPNIPAWYSVAIRYATKAPRFSKWPIIY